MSIDSEHQEWHVLDFYSDEHGDCALTVLARGDRFHVIADASKLDPDTQVGVEYRQLLSDFTGNAVDDAGGQPRQDQPNGDPDTDSGVDVTEHSTNMSKSDPQEENTHSMSAEGLLQTWIFAPLATNLDDLAPKNNSTTKVTLQEWYHCPTRFCELAASADGQEVEAVELENTSELKKRIENLRPNATLPKYLTKQIDIPIYHASDLHVLEASDQPVGTPYHPCRVRLASSDITYFLKVVDNTQPATTKRELDILNRISSLGLHKQMHVPVLEGLVMFDEASTTTAGKRRIMGFLQTNIPDPTPLTNMFDPSVSQTKRTRWAKRAEQMKDILHKNNIIWGDAKADNFMVDKNDNLWMIDFGGSYTEGWVDPELMETLEGDDVGTEKVVNALKDPVANTVSFEDDSADQKPSEEGQKVSQRKRKMIEDETESTADADATSKPHTNYKRRRLSAY